MKDYSKVDAWLETWGEERRGGRNVTNVGSLLGKMMEVRGHINDSDVTDLTESAMLMLQKSHVGAYNVLWHEYIRRRTQRENAEKLNMSYAGYRALLGGGKIAMASILGVSA